MSWSRRARILAPSVVKVILHGHHPVELTAKRLANQLRFRSHGTNNARCSEPADLFDRQRQDAPLRPSGAEVHFPARDRMAARPTPTSHRPRCRTTNNAVRDFRDRSGPFVARVRSHVTATTGTDALRRGKKAAIPPLCRSEKSFYINVLGAGGGSGIRTLSIPKHHPRNLMNSLLNSRFSTKTGTRDRE
jgi:hypothetical protein